MFFFLTIRVSHEKYRKWDSSLLRTRRQARQDFWEPIQLSSVLAGLSRIMVKEWKPKHAFIDFYFLRGPDFICYLVSIFCFKYYELWSCGLGVSFKFKCFSGASSLNNILSVVYTYRIRKNELTLIDWMWSRGKQQLFKF